MAGALPEPGRQGARRSSRANRGRSDVIQPHKIALDPTEAQAVYFARASGKRASPGTGHWPNGNANTTSGGSIGADLAHQKLHSGAS
jgi:hypothetical protein